MEKTDTAKPSIPEFSFGDFAASDTAEMTVIVGGKLTDWHWIFAGPGHPQTVATTDKRSREQLHQARENEQTRLNGKKVKLPEESVDEVRAKNIGLVVDRIVGWSPVRIDGADYPYSPDNAKKLLSDRRNLPLLTQALEFIAADDSFTARSV